MKGWNLKMGLPNHLCLVKSWLRFACQLQLAKLCFQTESQLLINSLCKWIWHSLEILAVSSNQDIRIYKIYCIFVIGIHVELRLFGYSDFSWNIQICNLSLQLLKPKPYIATYPEYPLAIALLSVSISTARKYHMWNIYGPHYITTKSDKWNL